MKFNYRALSVNDKVVTGSIDCENTREASRTLKKQGLTLVALDSAESEAARAPIKNKKIKRADALLLMGQLQTLLAAGVTLNEAIEALAEAAANGVAQAELLELSKRLKRGERLSAALEEIKLPLPAYIYHLIAAGEMTGALAEALADGVAQMEYEQRIAGELKNALIYPLILIISGLGAVALIFTLVVPKFVNLLDGADDSLPFLAWAVLSSGQFMNENGGLVLLFVALLGMMSSMLLFRPDSKVIIWDKLLNKPLIGRWLLETDLARWGSMLGTLLGSRVELTQALELAQQTIVSARLRNNMSQVSNRVRAGKKLSEALKETGMLSATSYGLIRVGERSGELTAMLKKMAEMYNDSRRERMKRFLTLLEPVAILSIGAVIGLIMTGIILAITSVNEIAL